MSKFLGTRIIGTKDQYVVADVVSDGAQLPHSVRVEDYIENLLSKIETLKAEVANLNEGAKLLHSVAMKGEQSALSRLDGGVDAVDAERWQDEKLNVNISYFGIKATATPEWVKRHLNS